MFRVLRLVAAFSFRLLKLRAYSSSDLIKAVTSHRTKSMRDDFYFCLSLNSANQF
jgi:hypothetical protein